MKKMFKKILALAGYDIFPIYTLPFDVRQMNLYTYFYKRYASLKSIKGDLVECGVGKGRTFLYLSFLAYKESKGRKLWGFDSFEGFPEPSVNDASPRNPKKGEWSDTSVEMVLGQLERAGLPEEFINNQLSLIKGFFPHSFEKYNKRPIALLHVDVDLYQSYKDTLDFFYPFVVESGVVLFDEYNEERWPGAKKAVDEFLAATGNTLQFDEDINKYFVIKKT